MVSTAASAPLASGQVVSKAEERKVIFASSLGTVFEWYDFYLYATLAPFFAALFFPPGNDTAALLSAYANDSIKAGDPLQLHVSAAKPWVASVYRIGHFGGKGGTKVAETAGSKKQFSNEAPDPQTRAVVAGWPVVAEVELHDVGRAGRPHRGNARADLGLLLLRYLRAAQVALDQSGLTTTLEVQVHPNSGQGALCHSVPPNQQMNPVSHCGFG